MTQASDTPLLKKTWRHLRERISRSQLLAGAIASVLVAYLRLVKRTNRLTHDDGPKVDAIMAAHAPAIYTCWHGQHFMLPFLIRDGEPSAMLVSRSFDAELNAKIVEKAGIRALRGSGGRLREQTLQKGGIRALIALRAHLKTGRSVAFIADIPHTTARQSGMGVISLAKMTGCPIIPIAFATSRRFVFQKSWDKAALNLPFGRAALYAGDPVFVPEGADESALSQLRQLLDDRLNDITEQAYECVDSKSSGGS